MRFLNIVLGASVAVLIAPSLGQAQNQKSQPGIWESGNVFLQYCDETNTDFVRLFSQDKQMLTVVCNFWVLGIRQGIEMSQEVRPEPPAPPPAIVKQNKEQADRLEKLFGPGSWIDTPARNMCIPNDVTPNQLRLVVIQWMKANPTKLKERCLFTRR